jgi:hypothetical protein
LKLLDPHLIFEVIFPLLRQELPEDWRSQLKGGPPAQPNRIVFEQEFETSIHPLTYSPIHRIHLLFFFLPLRCRFAGQNHSCYPVIGLK